MESRIRQIYQFGQFQLDPTDRLLLRRNETVPIAPKVLDLLLALIERQGSVVEKNELMQVLWPDTYVEENNLTVTMSALRKTLGEGKDGAKYIETIPRRGYRFVAPVITQTSGAYPLPTAPATIPAESSDVVYDENGHHNGVARTSLPPSNHSLPMPVTKPATAHGSSSLVVTPPASKAKGTTTRFLLLGAALLILAGAAVVPWMRRPPSDLSEVHSVAILPFRPLNEPSDEEVADESLGLGLADALITKLSNTGKIVVRPTSAIIKYSRQLQDVTAAGRELGVDAVLDGRVQRAGDHIRITVQFIRLPDGTPVWADSYDERFTNILTVQNIISEKVAYALTLKLTESERQRLFKRYTDNTAAFELYLKGRYFWNKRNAESNEKAIEYFQQAIQLDPGYALAYAGLADCYISLATPQVLLMGRKGEEYWDKANVAARKALELDESLAEAHTSLGAVLASSDDAGAHREFDRAIELNPNYVTVYNFYTVDLIGDAQLDRALEMARRAHALDPLSVPSNTNYGIVLCRLRRGDEAIEQFKKTLELDQASVRAHWGLGLAYEQKGQYEDAVAEFQQALKLSNNGILALASLGHVYGVSGRQEQAKQVLAQMLERAKNGERHPYYLAAVYAGMGDVENAFATLEKARGQYARGLLKNDQFFDALRSDSRYEGLLK